MNSKAHHPKSRGTKTPATAPSNTTVGKEFRKSSSSTKAQNVVDVTSAPVPLADTHVTAKRFLDNDERHHLIEQAAYFRAADRGFQPQDPLNDWLKAQAEINEVFSGEQFLAA